MNGTIQSAADLRRANIRLAWAFADRMTHTQFLQLIDVTIEDMRGESLPAAPVRLCNPQTCVDGWHAHAIVDDPQPERGPTRWMRK